MRAISQQASLAEEAELRRIIDGPQAEAFKKMVLAVDAPRPLRQYAIRLVLLAHPNSEKALASAKKYLRYGSSPRGVQALILGAKVMALIDGRDTAQPADVMAVARVVLGHRLMLNFEGEAENVTPAAILNEAMEAKELGGTQ